MKKLIMLFALIILLIGCEKDFGNNSEPITIINGFEHGTINNETIINPIELRIYNNTTTVIRYGKALLYKEPVSLHKTKIILDYTITSKKDTIDSKEHYAKIEFNNSELFFDSIKAIKTKETGNKIQYTFITDFYKQYKNESCKINYWVLDFPEKL